MTEAEVKEMRALDLDALGDGLPGVTAAQGKSHVEACMVRFDDRGHASGCELLISGDLGEGAARLTWAGTVNGQMQRGWNDDEVTTEWAAYAIAFILVLELTNYTVIRKSKKGTGFDYWLGFENDDIDIFADSARLEVSGLRNPTQAEFERRVREKTAQTAPTDGQNLPAYIVVTDFASPKTRVVVK